MLNAFKTLFFVCLMMVAGQAQAKTNQLEKNTALITDIRYCNQANLDLRQAMQCDFQSEKKNTQSGFSEETRWVRLRVKSPEQAVQAIAIHVGPYFLSDIQLFEKIADRWISQEAGSHLPASNPHAEIGGYSFISQMEKTNENTYYLSIKASSLSNFFVVAEPWPTTNPYNHKLGIGMQFGALLLVLAFSLLSYWLNPNPLMFRFSVFMLVIVLSLAAGSGLLAHYLLPESPKLNQLAVSLLVCLRLGFWIALARVLLKPYQTPQWYVPSCHATYAAVAISMLLIVMDLTYIAYSLVFSAMLIAPILQMVAIGQCHDIEKPFRRVMLAGFFMHTLLIVVLVVAVRYSLAGSYLPIYLARMTDFVAPLVLLSIILFQQRLKSVELIQVKNALLESDLRSQFEQKQLAERSLLIDMLAHELKNPLTAIGMASSSLSHDLEKLGLSKNRRLDNIKLSIANMDRIIERCVLMNTVDRQEQNFYKVPVDLPALLARCLAHFDQAERLHLNMDAAHSVKTDAYLLEIAINNLIGNALKYSPPNSPVQITVYKQASQIKIAIANQIYLELAPDETALFKRFYRHPLAHKVSGSGLGLYLTKGLCQLLDARVSYTKKDHAVEFLIALKA